MKRLGRSCAADAANRKPGGAGVATGLEVRGTRRAYSAGCVVDGAVPVVVVDEVVELSTGVLA